MFGYMDFEFEQNKDHQFFHKLDLFETERYFRKNIKYQKQQYNLKRFPWL